MFAGWRVLFLKLNLLVKSLKVIVLLAIYSGRAIIKIWAILAIESVIFSHLMKKYTMAVDITTPEKQTVRYRTNLFLIKSFLLKFFLRLRVNDIINPHTSHIIFEIIIGNHSLVRIRKTQQSITAAKDDNAQYKKACLISSFAVLRICAFIIILRLIYKFSFLF